MVEKNQVKMALRIIEGLTFCIRVGSQHHAKC